MTPKEKADDVFKEIIDMMMETCGYNARLDDLKALSKLGCAWYYEYTCTPKEAERFKNLAIPLIQKRCRVSKQRAKDKFNYFWCMYGLREVGTEIVANKA